MCLTAFPPHCPPTVHPLPDCHLQLQVEELAQVRPRGRQRIRRPHTGPEGEPRRGGDHIAAPTELQPGNREGREGRRGVSQALGSWIGWVTWGTQAHKQGPQEQQEGIKREGRAGGGLSRGGPLLQAGGRREGCAA